MNHYQIRPMTAEDLTAVHRIECQVQSHPWSLNQFRESLASYHCTVMTYQQHIIGFCILQCVLDEASLLLIAITPAYQGKGLGERLLTQSIEALPQQPLQVFLEVRESNHAAIRLYEKLHFHQIDLRRNYYPSLDGGKEHAVIMVKSFAENFSDLFKSN